jgi:hypothetical protein
MRNLVLSLLGVAALLAAGTLAHATTLSGAGLGVAPAQSSVELAGCKGPGLFCPFGRQWMCPPGHACWCGPCGAYKLKGGKWRSG